MRKRLRIFIGVLLVLSIANYLRLDPSTGVRSVEFLSILVMGALAGILLTDALSMMKRK